MLNKKCFESICKLTSTDVHNLLLDSVVKVLRNQVVILEVNHIVIM